MKASRWLDANLFQLSRPGWLRSVIQLTISMNKREKEKNCNFVLISRMDYDFIINEGLIQTLFCKLRAKQLRYKMFLGMKTKHQISLEKTRCSQIKTFPILSWEKLKIILSSFPNQNSSKCHHSILRIFLSWIRLMEHKVRLHFHKFIDPTPPMRIQRRQRLSSTPLKSSNSWEVALLEKFSLFKKKVRKHFLQWRSSKKEI